MAVINRSPQSSPALSTGMIVSFTIVVVTMIAAITLNLLFRRDPSVLVNFCGIILVQASSTVAILWKVNQTSQTVEDLANGHGQRKLVAAIHDALRSYDAAGNTHRAQRATPSPPAPASDHDAER